MNEIDLTPKTEPISEESSEASPMLIFLGALTMATVLTLLGSYAMGHRLLLILSAIFSPVFVGCFGLEYFGLVHFTFRNEYEMEPAPQPTIEEIMKVQPTAEELRAQADAIDRSNNIIPQHNFNTTLGWTCSYCDTTNIWKPGQTEVRCVHCGARYEGNLLWDLKVIR